MQFMRKEVVDFAEKMERVLKENDYKCGWKDCSDRYLLKKLTEEFGEVLLCFLQGFEWTIASETLRTVHTIIGSCDLAPSEYDKEIMEVECVDLANIAMMICDKERLGNNATHEEV